MIHQGTTLIVEDNDDDYEVCVTTLSEENNRANPLVRCETGDEALDYLYARGEYANDLPGRPGLILLDLNLPGTDGREVLTQIKTDNVLKKIPVVVMTASSDDKDIDTCYEIGANSYVVKPVDINGFFDAIARLRNYWFKIVILPELDR
jgi:CheY-like chemotaxis protein